MLPLVCSVIDHRRRKNVICDLLLNRSTATWNQFVKNFVCTCSSVKVKAEILHTIHIFYILISGDNLIVGSYDRRLCWFDMDLSTKPYKTLR